MPHCRLNISAPRPSKLLITRDSWFQLEYTSKVAASYSSRNMLDDLSDDKLSQWQVRSALYPS
ncbi:hypothetical protein EMIT0P74_80138 [Pseudomonas sp. IT-P74]